MSVQTGTGIAPVFRRIEYHARDSAPPPKHPMDAPETLARRFYQHELLHELSGRRVRFVEDVKREGFTVQAGATGVVMDPFLNEGLLVAAVKLDNEPETAAEYDYEVHWVEDYTLIDFEEQIELL